MECLIKLLKIDLNIFINLKVFVITLYVPFHKKKKIMLNGNIIYYTYNLYDSNIIINIERKLINKFIFFI